MTALENGIPEISGSETVSKWFGGWPCFEAAEIIYLNLARKGEAQLRLYPAGSSATVEFWLRKVRRVSLNGFAEQNFLRSLTVGRSRVGDIAVWSLEIEGESGLGGVLECEELRVRVEPIEFSNPF